MPESAPESESLNAPAEALPPAVPAAAGSNQRRVDDSLCISLPGEGGPHRLRGPGGRKLRFEGVRRIEPEEELLLPHLPVINGRALVPLLHGAPALPATLAALNPGARIEVWEPDMHDARLLRDKFRDLPNITVTCTADPEPDPAAAEHVAFLLVRRDLDRLLALDLLERFSRILPPGSPVLVVMPRKRAPDLRQKMQRLLAGLTDVAHGDGLLLLSGRTRPESFWTPRLCPFTATTPGASAKMVTRPGVFCHGRPDAGGTALAESTEPAGGERILELGCGCGLTSLLLAMELRGRNAPPAHFTLVDSHARAVECARLGIAANGLDEGFQVVHDDMFTPEPGAFDLFLGNPPYYADRRISAFFLDTAFRALRPGGSAVLVSKHEGEIRELAEERGFTVETRHRRGYAISICTKN